MNNFDEILKKAEQSIIDRDYMCAANYCCNILINNSNRKPVIKLLKSLYSKFNDKSSEITIFFIKTIKDLYKKHEYSLAEDLAFLIFEISKSKTPLMILGDLFLSENKADKAIKCYGAITGEDSSNAECLFNLGIAYSLKGFFEEAHHYYKKAIASEPDNTKYNCANAYLYYLEKDYEKSEIAVNKVLSKDENHEKAIAIKILLSLQANDLFFAKKFVNKKSIENTNDDMLCYAHAMYYLKINNIEKAISEIIRAIKLNPYSVEYAYEAALMYFNIQNYQKSSGFCDFILKHNNKYMPAKILKAKIYIQQNETAAAFDTLKECCELDMNCDEIYYLFGIINISRNDFVSATDNLKTALSINPGNTLYYEKAAECYIKLSDFENAGLYYKEAADIDVSNATYRYNAAKCFEKTGKNKDAEINYETARRLDLFNYKYIEDYVLFLCKIGKKNRAEKLLKIIISEATDDDKQRLKILLNKIKR